MTLQNKYLTTALGLICLLHAPEALAESLIIALPASGDAEQRKVEAIEAIKLATKVTNVGETSHFVNGQTGQSIGDFRVPNKNSYRSDKAKLNANKSAVKAVLGFSQSASDDPYDGALDIPGTLRTLIKSHDMDEVDAIVFTGNPLFHSESEARLSMASGYVASDGHIRSSATLSHFGMAGFEGQLKGTPIHISTEGYDWSDNTRHFEATERFYGLSIDYLGGALVTFNADRARMMERVQDGVEIAPRRFTMSRSKKREMLYMGRDRRDALPIHERRLSRAPISAVDLKRARNVEVGIRWDCACDIDIFARPHPDADILYYGFQRSREGQFYKDYRDASELLNGLESISFDAPIDLNALQIGINFYSGQASAPLSGEIRLTVNGRTYARPFNMAASTGNAGAGRNGAFESTDAPNDHWVIMRGVDIV